MDWDAIGAVGEIVGALAVVSLFSWLAISDASPLEADARFNAV
jgi:hypothetical protein